GGMANDGNGSVEAVAVAAGCGGSSEAIARRTTLSLSAFACRLVTTFSVIEAAAGCDPASGMLLRLRMLAQAAPATRKQPSALIVIPLVNSYSPSRPLRRSF